MQGFEEGRLSSWRRLARSSTVPPWALASMAYNSPIRRKASAAAGLWFAWWSSKNLRRACALCGAPHKAQMRPHFGRLAFGCEPGFAGGDVGRQGFVEEVAPAFDEGFVLHAEFHPAQMGEFEREFLDFGVAPANFRGAGPRPLNLPVRRCGGIAALPVHARDQPSPLRRCERKDRVARRGPSETSTVQPALR